jgi:hypothetical protein
MKMLTLLVSLSLALSCGSSGSSGIPQADACNQTAKTSCMKIFSCPTLAAQAASVPSISTEAMCEATVLASCGLTFMCGVGETYHGDKAQACKDAFSAQTCDDLQAAVVTAILGGATIDSAIPALTKSLPACAHAMICSGGADGGPG